MSDQNMLSRRDFIKDAAVAGAAVATAGVLGAATAQAQTGCALPGVPAKWDYETDVVVVGYGGAGAFASMAAAEAGAKVIVLEKAPKEGGGSTRMSGANFTITDNPDEAVKYLSTASGLSTPVETIKAWAAEIAKTPAWFDKRGFKYAPAVSPGPDFKNFPGAASIKSIAVTGGGPELFKRTDAIVKANKDIQVMVNTPATALVQNPATKEVLGVLANTGGKAIAVKAKRGVILTAGGFEYNDLMKNNYLRPETLKGVGWVHNTGDGIRMAQAVGADLMHMNGCISSGMAFVTPASEMGLTVSVKAPNFVQVDRFGARFICENPAPAGHRVWMYFDIWDWSTTQKDGGYRVIPSYFIFDETARKAGGLAGAPRIGTEFGAPEAWSQDNQVEIGKGWIKKGNTIEELAKAIGADMDPAGLRATVDKYNGYVKAGKDPDFNRDPKSLAPIETPPFYALPFNVGIFSTFGGPRKNEKAQVLDTNQKVIARLYVAGTNSHSCGHLYSTYGQCMAENFSFGNIAGRNAAAEKAWDAAA